MRHTFPVIWMWHGQTHTGGLEQVGSRVELTARGRTFAFRSDSVIRFVIRRGPADRVRGLPVLEIWLAGGEQVCVASLGGAGSLHELAELVASQSRNESPAQPVAGSGT